jgi:hypothetical protein
MADKKTSANDAAKKAIEAAMAKKSTEKKKVEHTFVDVEGSNPSKEELLAATRQNALPYRVFAIICWVLAITAEVFAILFILNKIAIKALINTPYNWIPWAVCLALDLIFVIIGSLLWKKGNHLDPASKKNKTRFWIHNNLGVIVSIIAFLPFIILVLTDKKSDKKTKTIAVVAAAVALAIAIPFGVDWNPLSQEEMLENAHIDTVCWSETGSVYHLYEDCYHLNGTPKLRRGPSATAIEEGKTRMCKTCEVRAAKEAEELPEINSGEDKTPDTAEQTTAEPAA